MSAVAQTPTWSSNLGALGPTGLAIANVGTTTYLYVAEYNGGKIVAYNLTTGSTTPAAIVVPAGTFQNPNGIAVDPTTGDLFVTDRALNKVVRISNTGTVRWSYGATGEFDAPIGITRDSTGAIYVTNHNGNRVQKFTVGASGLVPVTTGWPLTGFDVPYSVATDSANNVYIGDRSGTIRKYSSAGAAMTAGNIATTGYVTGISFAGTAMYASHTLGDNSNRVRRFPAGAAPADLTFGADGSGNGQFNTMFNVVVNGSFAYASDFANNRVQVWNLAGGGSTDTAAPTATIAANGSTATANSVTFTVTFNETVTGAAATSFTAGGTATGVNITSVTPSATTATTSYTVTVGFTGTTGTVTLGTSAAATTAIKDASNNFYAGGAATATYTIPAAPPPPPAGDTTPPRVSNFTLQAGSATAGTWRITFDENVTGVDASDFVVIGGSGVTITGSPTVSAVDARTYDVNFTYSSTGTGYLQGAIRTSGTGIADAAGNQFVGHGTAATEVQGTGVSFTVPAVTSFTAGTVGATSVTLTLTFSEAVAGVSQADFVAPAGVTVGTPTGSGTTYSVPVSFSSSGTYTITVVGGATSAIRGATSTYYFRGGTTNSSVTFTAGSGGTAPTIAAQTVEGTVGTAMNYQVVATGATSFSTTSTMPANLTLSSAGVISGTPSAATPTAGTVVTVTATNANGSSSAPVTIKIAAAPPAGTAPTIAAQTVNGTVGTAMNYQVVATGATSFSTTSTMPANLTLSSTGVISGTPSAATPTAGTVVNVTATNANGSSSAAVTIKIAAAPPPVGSAPTITSATTASAKVGQAFSYQITASGSPTSYSATNLPANGLSLNASTGVISGTPQTTTTVTTQLRATNATGTSAPVTLTITVAAASTPPDTTAPQVNAFIKASNDASTVTFTLTFTESVVGVDASDFTITKSGTINPAISTVTAGSGGAWNITTTYTGTGSFNLVLKSSGTGIADTAGNLLVGGATSSAFSNGASAPPPPPSSPPPVFFPPPAVVTPVVKTNQTVTFVSPVSALLVNQSIALSATASSGLPVTFTLVTGNATLSGSTLTLRDTNPVVVRASQAGSATVNPASTEVTFTAQRTAQQLNVPTMGNRLTTDGAITLSATSDSGLAISYSLVSGPATLNGNTLTLTGRPGEVVINVTQAGNDSFLPATSQLRFKVDPAARLVNLSSRMNVSNDQPVIVGFVVSGTTDKQVLIRAVGPGLTAFGVTGALSNPRLQLFDGNGRMVAENDDWTGSDVAATADRVGAFRLTASSRDAAVVAQLAPGAYTAVVTGVNSTGVVLIEVYDGATREQIATQQLVNISTRGFVGSDQDSLIAGFVVTGSAPKRVLVRGIGPSLTQFGVTGAVSNPVLRLVAAGSEAALAQNDNWSTPVTVDARFAAATAADISAAGLASGAFPMSAGSNDAAIVISLEPGNYSAVMSGANNATGTGLIEVYELPNP